MQRQRLFRYYCLIASSLLAANPSVCIGQIYVLVDTTDNSSMSIQAGVHIGIQLQHLLEQHFSQTVKLICPNRLAGMDADQYAQAHGISVYVNPRVMADDRGLNLRIHLVTSSADESRLVTLGPDQAEDTTIIRSRIQNVPIVLDALMDGIAPENLIYVDCFGFAGGAGQNQAIRGEVTLGLWSELAALPISNSFFPYGLRGTSEFDLRCVDHKFTGNTDFFNYIIEGTIQPIASDPNGRFQIRVRINEKRPTHAMYCGSVAVDQNREAEQLASYVVMCWDRWGQPGCS